MDIILYQELRDKNIFFNDGFVSIYLMLSDLAYKLPDTNYRDKILLRIKESGMWNLLTSEPQYLDRYRGLYSGFCGTALFMEMVKNSRI
jgi:hypothetical protein